MADYYFGNGTPTGYQQITDVSAATALTVPAGSQSAVVAVSAQAVRMLPNGDDPTDSVGFPVAAGTVLNFLGGLANLRFIEVTGGAVLDVLYFR